MAFGYSLKSLYLVRVTAGSGSISVQFSAHFGYRRGRCLGDRADYENSELVGILGHGEAWYGLAGALPFYFNAKDGGGFPTGGAKDGESSQGFTIKARNEERLLAARPFPHLTDLNLGNRHFGRVSK